MELLKELYGIHSPSGNEKAMKKFASLGLSYPTGCILAKATITDCVAIDDKMKKKLNLEDPLVYSGVVKDSSWIGYGFQLENIEKIDPIYINGKLSFWEYPYEEK